MRKMMLLAALLAMFIVAAVPAVAQISQENEQESESGNVDQSFEISGGGDNSNQCVGVQGIANTGNDQNQILNIKLGGDISRTIFDVYAPEDINMNGNIRWAGLANDQNLILNIVLAGSLVALYEEQF